MPDLTKRELLDLLDANGDSIVEQLAVAREEKRAEADKAAVPKVKLSSAEWAAVKALFAANEGKTGDFFASYREAVAAIATDDKDAFVEAAFLTLIRMRGGVS